MPFIDEDTKKKPQLAYYKSKFKLVQAHCEPRHSGPNTEYRVYWKYNSTNNLYEPHYYDRDMNKYVEIKHPLDVIWTV